MSPLPKIPIQGDIGKLEQLSSGTKRTGGTFGEVVQRTPAGRPQGSTTTPQAPSGMQPAVRPEHQQVFDELAQAEAIRQQWEQVAAQSPTPWVQGMLKMAEQNFQAAAVRAYNVVPNAEF